MKRGEREFKRRRKKILSEGCMKMMKIFMSLLILSILISGLIKNE